MRRLQRAIGATVLLAAALLIAMGRGRHERRPTEPLRRAEVPVEAPHSEEAPPPPLPEAAVVPAPAPASVPTDDAAAMQQQKQRMARDAEAERIAAREQKLAALDWAAPRPGPPPADRRAPISKKEEELTPGEKLEKTERITSELRERIQRAQKEVDQSARSGGESGAEVMLLARLQSRVSELEQRAEELRGRNESAQPGGPAPVTGAETTQ